jgi:hypothetical protein
MIPFFSISSKNFDQDLTILKKFYISLNKEHILKMYTSSVKEQHWLQDGGFMKSSLSLTLCKRFFS